MAYTIMVVDDSEIICEVIERTIHMTKLPVYEILKAKNGIDALAQLENNWIDI